VSPSPYKVAKERGNYWEEKLHPSKTPCGVVGMKLWDKPQVMRGRQGGKRYLRPWGGGAYIYGTNRRCREGGRVGKDI